MTSLHKPLVFIISAPSGSGKSTLVNKLLKSEPDLDFSISYTTREPRGNEKDGKQYFFVGRPKFKQMIAADEFLEHAEVFGNYYGTPRRFLRQAEKNGHDLLLDIDVQGAEQVHRKLPEAVSIFILPPDRQTLEQRLRHRCEDSEEVIQKRLVAASREIENYNRYNYILINDRLDESSEGLKAIVHSERLRHAGGEQSEEDRAAWALADRSRLSNVRDRVQPILASFAASTAPGRA
ncbi:MAG TPA: guanylate kinase [Candidatus Aquilonibacter sp.]|nr:guanylate kinase [Candidatus Aquilonibacter sp.]